MYLTGTHMVNGGRNPLVPEEPVMVALILGKGEIEGLIGHKITEVEVVSEQCILTAAAGEHPRLRLVSGEVFDQPHQVAFGVLGAGGKVLAPNGSGAARPVAALQSCGHIDTP